MGPMSRMRLPHALLLAVTVSAMPAAPAAATDDVTPPSVVARSPGPDGVIGTGGAVAVTFDEAVANVDAATFQLSTDAGQAVEASVAWNPDTVTATLTPMSRLTVGAAYVATLRATITDLAGNPLPRIEWSFSARSRATFAPGRYTGYRFESDDRTFTAVKRATVEEPMGTSVKRFRRIGGQGYVYVSRGTWAGYWVHARRWGEALDDVRAPITPRPGCSYRDLPTARVGYGKWGSTVLDTLFRLPRGYAPGDLVDTSRAGLNGGHRIRSLTLSDLGAMVAAARRDGASLAVQSAYRSYDSQVASFDYWVRRIGRAEALKVSARPGHSEHQLGTTIDFRSAGGPAPWEVDWGGTREGTWMARHAWKYGWVLSYPSGATAASCYSFEPWHFRYVGREAAAAVREAAAVPRAWLWSRGYGVR